MTDTEKCKLEVLKNFFAKAGSAAVAFSGGVDSTLLVKAAHDVLGSRMIAVTLVSSSFPDRERKEAAAFCCAQGITQIEIEYDELAIKGFAENPMDRCYLCKKELFRMINACAAEHSMAVVCEGSNMDDLGDYRPGLKAIREMGVKSPLQEAELTKNEIRNILKASGLEAWNKPSLACLATRFVYGETITREKLVMVGKAEQLLSDLGFKQFRVRLHGNIARIELPVKDFDSFMKEEIRLRVAAEFKAYGFDYVTLDIQGFRSGSMNVQAKK